MIAMLNTHTSANMAGVRLTRTPITHGQNLADHLAQLVWTHILAQHRNPPHAPAANRELAVRAVLTSPRALDIGDIVTRLDTHPDY